MGQKFRLCMTLAATLMTLGALNLGGEFTAVTVAANGLAMSLLVIRWNSGLGTTSRLTASATSTRSGPGWRPC